MLIVILLISSALLNAFGQSKSIFQDLSIHDKIITDVMMDLISQHHLNQKKLTVLIYGFAPEMIYRHFFSLGVDFVVMNNLERDPNTFTIEMPNDFTEDYIQRPANVMFFFVNTFEDISQGIHEISQTIFWTVKAKFIIYIREKCEKQKIFYLIWWYFSLNCLILEFDSAENIVKMSEYTPYVVNVNYSNPNQYGCWSTMNLEQIFDGNMGPYVKCNDTCNGLDFNRYSETMYIQTCLEIETKTYEKSMITLPDKTLDLGGFTLRMFIVDLPPVVEVDMTKKGLDKFKGKDGYIVKVIADKMNLKFTYSTDPNILFNPQFQTWVNGLMDMSYRRYDYYANVVYLLPFSFPALDTSYPVEGSGLCFVVHRGGLIPTWVNLIHMFDIGSLIMVTIIFNVTALIYYYFLLMSGNKSYLEPLTRSYLYALQIFLSTSVNWTDRNNSIRVFSFIIFWFIFVVNFVFQGTIVSLLTIPRLEPDINTFQELYDTGYLIEGYPSPDVLLPQTSDLYIGINKRFKPNTVLFSCMHDLKKKLPKACWMDCMLIQGLQRSQRDEDGKLYVHIGQDRVHSHHLVYPQPRNSPLKPRFDHYIKKLFESGLLNKWRNFKMGDVSDGSVENKILNLEDLQGCFYILLFGYIGALVAFVTEYLIYVFSYIIRNHKKIFQKVTNCLCCCYFRKCKKT